MMMPKDNFGLGAETVSRICSVFSAHPEVIEVRIYGSRAKGNYRSGSDIDLTMMGSGITTSMLFRVGDEIDELLLPYKVDLSVYKDIDNIDLLEHIERVGQVFYKSENNKSV